MQDVRRFHQAFYSDSNKVSQDSLLLKYCTGEVPKRERIKVEGSSRKGIAIKYHVKTFRQMKGATIIQVCQQSFLSILGVSKSRVQRVVKKHLETGQAPKENRGGDTRSKSFSSKRDAVKTFIAKYKPVESHYSRNKSQRHYLPSHLTVRKMWRAYNEVTPLALNVKYQYFRTIFVTDFNISFKMPATDACSTCIQLKEMMKHTDNSKVKEQLRVEYHVHNLKANAFYQSLKTEKPHTCVFSFDCQKNMTLPKIPDQAAYYSRQLYSYNFTICQGNSGSPQTKDTVFIYNWLENQFTKDSNVIASAVYNRLCSTDFTDYDTIELYADGCSGQNKNSTMVGMLGHWLSKNAPTNIQNINLIFPVVGHSFLPPDRVFGRIEKVVRKQDTIIHADEYAKIFSNFGTVCVLGTREIKVFDWKLATSENTKPPGSWHFKFLPCKRICLKRNTSGTIVIKGEVNYRTDLGQYRGICKKGKCFSGINPGVIEVGQRVKLNPHKLRDVDNLLKKHFGDGWRDSKRLQYYKDIIDKCAAVDENINVEDEEGEYVEEEFSFSV